MVNDREVRRRTADIIQRFDVRPPNPALPARALSGGNQQKLIIGREFELKPRLLLVAQPTRGVDIGAIEFIHRKLVALRDAGCAVLLVSAELEEVMSLSDRLLVIHDGRIAGEVDPAVAKPADVGILMTGRMMALLFPFIAVVAAFLVGGVFVLAIGDNPIETYRLLIGSALWWPDGIGYTLFLATPLIFTGLAVSVAFRAGLLNIGAEGQLYIAAFATAWVGIVLGSLPAVVLVPLCFAAAIAAGAVVGRDSGVAEGAVRLARSDQHDHDELHRDRAGELLHAVSLSDARRSDSCRPAPISAQAHICQARADSFRVCPTRIPLNVSFLLALAASALVYVFLWRTKWGYELRATGSNPSAAEYGGISVRRQIVLAMAISGGLAGMVGINEVLGYRHRYYDGFSDSYGFTGIAVALLGRNHPVGVIFAALLFAVLTRGGVPVDAFTEHVTKDIVQILQATIILFVAAEAFFREPISAFADASARQDDG